MEPLGELHVVQQTIVVSVCTLHQVGYLFSGFGKKEIKKTPLPSLGMKHGSLSVNDNRVILNKEESLMVFHSLLVVSLL